MNMIMGPNGTGKSTFVAAVALGLGFNPSALGRSKNTAEFIKYDTSCATIEIILKCENFDDNPNLLPYVTIKRGIRRVNVDECENDFFINGNITTQKTVLQFAAELGVQITNLCQFLPQDKVSEFAKMTPEMLLIETMKAAASEATFSQFGELVDLRKQERSIAKTLENDTKELANNQRNINELVEIRRRAAEREERRKKLDLLKKKRPWILYQDERSRCINLKKEYDGLKAELEAATLEADQDLFNEIKRVESSLKQSVNRLKQLSARVRSSKGEVELLHSESFSLGSKIDSIKTGILKHRILLVETREKYEKDRQALRRTEEELAVLKEQTERVDDLTLNVGAGDAELNRISNQIGDVEIKLNELNTEKDVITERSTILRDKETKTFKKIEDIRSIRTRRIDALSRANKDTHSAARWLKENQDHFHGKLIGPICLELNVKNDRMAQAVESVISRSVLVSFVCDNFEDYEEFGRICEEKGWRGVNSILLENYSEGATLPQSPLSRKELKSLGFDCLLSDLIEGPEMIIWALHDMAKIHLIPVCLASGSNNIDISGCERIRSISKFLSPESFYEIRHSRYNDRDVATRSSPLKPGFILSLDVGANDSNIPELQSQLDYFREQLKLEQESMREVLGKFDGLQRILVSLKDRQEECKEMRKNALVKKAEFKKKDIAHIKLRKEVRDSLKFLQEQADEGEPLEELKHLIRERAGIVSKLRESLERLNDLVVMAGVEDMEGRLITLKLRHLEGLRDQKKGLHENLRRRIEFASNDWTASKERAKSLLEIAGMEGLTEEAKTAFATLPNGIEDLDRAILEEEARLRATGSGERFTSQNSDDLERKSMSIRELELKITRIRSEIQNIKQKIDEIRPIWLHAVTEMISKISEKFQDFMTKLDNGGLIKLDEPTNPSDFDSYNLEIQVKFRADEELQRLTSQRHSGGEKSVSTILFLMSLQELSRAPFRVVDEINQGMDVINERKVHALMVETATASRGKQAQYFLITPKLLTGLEYNEKMHMLCIYNGLGVMN